jgi:heparanase 1
MYEYRPPVDLANARLRKLAEALGPAYIRVSGTWANTTYFQDSPGPAPKTPPSGFGGVLTQQQWKGVVDFSKAVNAELVTSVAISSGVRDASRKWTPIEAAKIFAYTKSVGGMMLCQNSTGFPNLPGQSRCLRRPSSLLEFPKQATTGADSYTWKTKGKHYNL